MALTDEVLAEAYAKRCKKCRYRGPKGGSYQCSYLLVEGHMQRGVRNADTEDRREEVINAVISW